MHITLFVADVLSTNDDVNAAIDAYKQGVEPHLAKYTPNERSQTRPVKSTQAILESNAFIDGIATVVGCGLAYLRRYKQVNT